MKEGKKVVNEGRKAENGNFVAVIFVVVVVVADPHFSFRCQVCVPQGWRQPGFHLEREVYPHVGLWD